jgi:hypothetical protein
MERGKKRGYAPLPLDIVHGTLVAPKRPKHEDGVANRRHTRSSVAGGAGGSSAPSSRVRQTQGGGRHSSEPVTGAQAEINTGKAEVS